MKFTWLTDIHLNLLTEEERHTFYKEIAETNCDGVFITGDIAEGSMTKKVLIEMHNIVKNPIYFVLGNHDYYDQDIAFLKVTMRYLDEDEECPMIYHLASPEWENWVVLKNKVLLLGIDNWYDGRHGDFFDSTVMMNDWLYIKDFAKAGREELALFYTYHQKILKKIQELADNAAEDLKKKLLKTIEEFTPEKIIILMHVPPFKEASLYKGKIASDDYLPFYSSKVTGNVLMEIATANPKIEFLVLCGHTHHYCHYKALDNLTVKVGEALYRAPQIQEPIEI